MQTLIETIEELAGRSSEFVHATLKTVDAGDLAALIAALPEALGEELLRLEECHAADRYIPLLRRLARTIREEEPERIPPALERIIPHIRSRLLISSIPPV